MFEERLVEVDWWIPGLREFDSVLLLLWMVVLPSLVGWGCAVILRLWQARRAGEIGPQEYRWRSSERFNYFGMLAINGCALIPMLFVIFTLLGLFGVALAVSDDVAWNLQMLSALVFWVLAYGWLVRRLRAGFHKPEIPNFGDDRPEEPVILRKAG